MRIIFSKSKTSLRFEGSPKPGDLVDFFISPSKKGDKATSLRKLDGKALQPDVVHSAERLTGFVTKECKDSLRSFAPGYNETAKEVAIRQGSEAQLGKIAVGEMPDLGSKRVTNRDVGEVSWRRANQLRKTVKEFAGSGDNCKKYEDEITSGEMEVVKTAAKQEAVPILKLSSGFALLRSKADLEQLRMELREVEMPQKESEDSENASGGEVLTESTSRSQSSDHYGFCSFDILTEEKKNSEWIPTVGDKVEFSLCKNKATGIIRATNITLLKSGSKKQRGIVDGSVHRYGFVRPLIGGEGSSGLYGVSNDDVDESFKPGGGGRDGTIRFLSSEIQGGQSLSDGDEVEYILVIDQRRKIARAIRVKLVKRRESAAADSTTRKVLNKEVLSKLASGDGFAGIVSFHQAKKPDGTNGFPAGRGRSIPAKITLNPSAKEWTPTFSK